MSANDFQKAWKDNSEGCGFSWMKDGKVHFKKGFMVEKEAWDFSETLEIPFVTHFRSASFGMPKTAEFTHPFIISKGSPLILEGQADSLLFHNGTEHNFETFASAAGIYLKDKEITSDSHIIARIVGINNNGDNKNNNYKFLSFLKSKFVLGDKDEKTFLYYGAFSEIDGIWYSNLTWRIQAYDHYSKKKTAKTSQMNGPNPNYSKCGAINIFEYPWNRISISETITKVPWERTMGFRYMMNRISLKAAQKIWRKLSNKKHFNFEKAEANVLKILKQQGKGNINGIDKWLERHREKESITALADKIIIDKMKENEEKARAMEKV